MQTSHAHPQAILVGKLNVGVQIMVIVQTSTEICSKLK